MRTHFGRFDAKDIGTVKALKLRGKTVELMNKVRGFGVMLRKATMGTAISGKACTMGGALPWRWVFGTRLTALKEYVRRP